MKLSKQDLSDMLQDTAGNILSEEEVSNAIEELESNTLEIEGYERSAWIKFDPKDPKTFPPVGSFLGYFVNDKRNEFQDVCFREPEDTEDSFAKREIYLGFTHWRPLPPKPVEKGKMK